MGALRRFHRQAIACGFHARGRVAQAGRLGPQCLRLGNGALAGDFDLGQGRTEQLRFPP
jgi:hypothetical protein